MQGLKNSSKRNTIKVASTINQKTWYSFRNFKSKNNKFIKQRIGGEKRYFSKFLASAKKASISVNIRLPGADRYFQKPALGPRAFFPDKHLHASTVSGETYANCIGAPFDRSSKPDCAEGARFSRLCLRCAINGPFWAGPEIRAPAAHFRMLGGLNCSGARDAAISRDIIQVSSRMNSLGGRVFISDTARAICRTAGARWNFD